MDVQEIRAALQAKEADLLEQMARLTRPEQDQGAISFGKRVGDGTAMAVDRLTAVGAHGTLQDILDLWFPPDRGGFRATRRPGRTLRWTARS